MATLETDIQTREPEIFAAGDTLLFQRYLQKFMPAAGWSLHYVLSDLAGNLKAEFQTAANPADASKHLADVDDFGAELAPGDYVLTGQAVNGAEKHQIYYGHLTLQPDRADGAGDGSIKTEAQEMIDILRDSLKELYRQRFQETNVQRSQFILQKQGEVLQQLQYWKEVRVNEIQMERARNGRPIGNTITPFFNIG